MSCVISTVDDAALTGRLKVQLPGTSTIQSASRRLCRSVLRHHSYATLVQSDHWSVARIGGVPDDLDRQLIRENVDRVNEIFDQDHSFGEAGFVPECDRAEYVM